MPQILIVEDEAAIADTLVYALQAEGFVTHWSSLGGEALTLLENGTFDLAMHAWYEPFERILELATEHGVRVSTPMMGERIDLQAPHAGRRWWREVVDSETQVQGYGCCRS